MRGIFPGGLGGKAISLIVLVLIGLWAFSGLYRVQPGEQGVVLIFGKWDGNLAPEGAVAKITGKEGTLFTGTANVFDAEEQMLEALEAKKIKSGDVIIIRYEGPRGGPGMPEMLTPTSAIMGAGLGNDVALLTDGRFSGGSHGFVG